jgi:hypothetical protein
MNKLFWKKFIFNKIANESDNAIPVVCSLPMASIEWQEQWPHNCPVIEHTADNISVGICWFYLKDNVCPRHGFIRKKK